MNYLKNISTEKSIERNDLIYAGAKLVRGKIGIPLRNPNRNSNVK